MCSILKISRSIYYYECKEKLENMEFVHSIKEIFRLSRNNYGTCKIKVELAKQGKIILLSVISLCKIRKILELYLCSC